MAVPATLFAYWLGLGVMWCLVLSIAIVFAPSILLETLLGQVIRRRMKRSEPHSKRAEEHRDNREYDQAIVEYDKAIALDVDNPWLYRDRAFIYELLRDYGNAIEDYTSAINIDLLIVSSTHSNGLDAAKGIREWSRYRRAKAYLEHNELDKAIVDFDTVFENDARLTYSARGKEFYYYRGLAHLGKRNYGLAVADLNEYIDLDRERIHIQDAYESRGKAYKAMGESDLAVADLQVAERVYWDVENYLFSAEDCLACGDWDLAIADCAAGIKLEQENAQLYYCRASAYYSKGEYDLAIANYTVAIDIDTDEFFWSLYREDGEHEGMANAYHSRGLAYLAKGNHREAITDFQKAVDFYNDHEGFHESLAQAFTAKEEHDRKITSGLGAQLNDIEGLRNRIEELLSNREYDRAVEVCTALMAMIPDNRILFEERGRAHYAKGQFDLAKADFQIAAHLESNQADSSSGQ